MGKRNEVDAILKIGKKSFVALECIDKEIFIKTSTAIPGTVRDDREKCILVPYSSKVIITLRNLFKNKLKLEETLLFEDLTRDLRIRNYSRKTLKSYIHFNRTLVLFSGKYPDEISLNDVMEFLVYCIEERNLSSSTLGLAISSIQHYYGKLKKKNWAVKIERPKKERRLPAILSKNEVQKIIESPKLLKHRLLLMLVYSSGLRVSEAVGLKMKYVDFERSLILIKAGKGKKDRYTMLSEKCAILLKQYLSENKPETWIFPGQNSGHCLSVRSAEKIFERAAQKCSIHKNVSIHSLRHAFASHLLENGTDIRYIQELLGHASIRTTQIYTHVTMKGIKKIQSPFDRMN